MASNTASPIMFMPFLEHGLAQPPTASTVSALTTPPEGGHISAFGEAVYTLTNASECNRRAAQEAARRAMEEIEALDL